VTRLDFTLVYLYCHLPTLPTYSYLLLPTSTSPYLPLPTPTYSYLLLPTPTYSYLLLPTPTYAYLYLLLDCWWQLRVAYLPGNR